MKDEKFQNNNAGDERYFSTSDYSQNNDAGWTSDHERSSYDQQFGSNHMDDRETDDWSQRGSYESGPEVPKKSRKKIGIMIGCGVAAVAVAIAGVILIPKLFIADKTKVMTALSEAGLSLVIPDQASVLSHIDMKALGETLKQGAGYVDFELSLDDIAGEGMESGFLTDAFGFSMHLGQDMENKQMSGNFAIDVMGTELFSADIYGNEEDFCFAVPEFYEGYIRIPTNNMISAYNASELGKNSPVEVDEDFSMNLFGNTSGNEDENGILSRYAADSAQIYDNLIVAKGDEKKEFEYGGKTWSADLYTISVKRDDYMQLLDHFLEDLEKNPQIFESYNVDVDIEAADIAQFRTDLQKMLQDDLKAGVYLTSQHKVAGMNAQLMLTNPDDGSDVIGIHFELVFTDPSDYAQGYRGFLNLSSVTETPGGFEFEKTLETTSDMTTSWLNIQLKDGDTPVLTFDAIGNYNETDGDFSYEYIFEDESGEGFSLGMEGVLNDVEEGKSFDMTMDRIYITDQTNYVAFTGTLGVGPLEEKIQEPEEPVYDLFAMSQSELETLMQEIQMNLYEFLMSVYGL